MLQTLGHTSEYRLFKSIYAGFCMNNSIRMRRSSLLKCRFAIVQSSRVISPSFTTPSSPITLRVIPRTLSMSVAKLFVRVQNGVGHLGTTVLLCRPMRKGLVLRICALVVLCYFFLSLILVFDVIPSLFKIFRAF